MVTFLTFNISCCKKPRGRKNNPPKLRVSMCLIIKVFWRVLSIRIPKVQTLEHIHNLVSPSFKGKLSPIDFSKVRNMARTKTSNHSREAGPLHSTSLSSTLSDKQKEDTSSKNHIRSELFLRRQHCHIGTDGRKSTARHPMLHLSFNSLLSTGSGSGQRSTCSFSKGKTENFKNNTTDNIQVTYNALP